MGEARKLADKLQVQVGGVILGGPDEPLDAVRRRRPIAYGADRCYIMRDPVLKGYRNEPFTKGLTDLVNKHQPEIMLLGATAMGRDLAGSVATTLGTGLTADCTELQHRRPRAGRHAPDLRRLAAVHDHDAGLPAADGHGAAARDADAAARRQRAPATSSRCRWAWSRPTSSPSCSTSSPTPTATRSTWPMPT